MAHIIIQFCSVEWHANLFIHMHAGCLVHSAHSITCLFDATLKLSHVLHYSGLKVHWMTMNFYGSRASEPDSIELQSCRCCFGLTKRGLVQTLSNFPMFLRA